MSPTLQTILALTIVAATAATFLWRSLVRKKKPGCAGCGSKSRGPAAFLSSAAKRRH